MRSSGEARRGRQIHNEEQGGIASLGGGPAHHRVEDVGFHGAHGAHGVRLEPAVRGAANPLPALGRELLYRAPVTGPQYNAPPTPGEARGGRAASASTSTDPTRALANTARRPTASVVLLTTLVTSA
jgi:hypothetical protein